MKTVLTCTSTSWEISTVGPSYPSPTTGERKRLGPNTVARFIRDILLMACFSETLENDKEEQCSVGLELKSTVIQLPQIRLYRYDLYFQV